MPKEIRGRRGVIRVKGLQRYRRKKIIFEFFLIYILE
jgi:hypothetical protein